MHKVKIETDPALVGIKDNLVDTIYKHILGQEGISESETSIIFANKSLIQRLKKQFFNLDEPTDVIAFRLNDYSINKVEGEIYICLPVAKENAEYFGEPYQREIARLIIHGSLHLLGCKDDTEEQRLEMQKLENKYLKDLEL